MHRRFIEHRTIWQTAQHSKSRTTCRWAPSSDATSDVDELDMPSSAGGGKSSTKLSAASSPRALAARLRSANRNPWRRRQSEAECTTEAWNGVGRGSSSAARSTVDNGAGRVPLSHPRQELSQCDAHLWRSPSSFHTIASL